MLTICSENHLGRKRRLFQSSSFWWCIVSRGEVCGAVSGAIMALGVLNGQLYDNITDVKDATRKDTVEFYKLFQEKFRHGTCYGLIGIDPNDPDAKQRASDVEIYKENCPKFVAEAVNIVLGLFLKKSFTRRGKKWIQALIYLLKGD